MGRRTGGLPGSLLWTLGLGGRSRAADESRQQVGTGGAVCWLFAGVLLLAEVGGRLPAKEDALLRADEGVLLPPVVEEVLIHLRDK